MARISTYTSDTTVEASDKLLGSNADGSTKNFSIQDIATFFKNTNAAGISGQIPYVYYNAAFGGLSGRPTGSITLANTDASTGFSTLTTVKISKFPHGASSKTAVNFINEFLYQRVIIVDFTDMNKFGVYTVMAVAQDSDETNFYDLTLRYVSGNGGIVSGQYYSLGFYTGAQDKNFTFSQGSAASTWTVAHYLNKFPSVTVKLSNGKIGQACITHQDKNNLTIEFSGANSGTAYLN